MKKKMPVGTTPGFRGKFRSFYNVKWIMKVPFSKSGPKFAQFGREKNFFRIIHAPGVLLLPVGAVFPRGFPTRVSSLPG